MPTTTATRSRTPTWAAARPAAAAPTARCACRDRRRVMVSLRRLVGAPLLGASALGLLCAACGGADSAGPTGGGGAAGAGTPATSSVGAGGGSGGIGAGGASGTGGAPADAKQVLLHDFIAGPTPTPTYVVDNLAYLDTLPFDGLAVH